MEEFLETDLEDWSSIFTIDRYFWTPFIFRGQANSCWLLETSIERALRVFSIHTYSKSYETEEQWMMHEFKRKYPLFSSLLPKQSDSFEWLAIMQHHGAPTRLLDFTESILIATYFSVHDAIEECSIWAVNMHVIRNNLHLTKHVSYAKGEALKDDINEAHIELANRYIGSKTGIDEDKIPNLVIPLEPKICTERLSRQQGLFLMPTNYNKTFLENLSSSYLKPSFNLSRIPFHEFIKNANNDRLNSKAKIIKINVPQALHTDILHSLKQMNITAETLFPGVDGLAKSLQQSHIRL